MKDEFYLGDVMGLNVKVGMCSTPFGCDMALDTKWVEWTPELQEAWDKQQESEIRNPFGYESSSTLNPIPSGYCSDCGKMLHKTEHSYCPDCGQKLKWGGK